MRCYHKNIRTCCVSLMREGSGYAPLQARCSCSIDGRADLDCCSSWRCGSCWLGPLRSVYNGIERVRGSGYFYNSGNSSAVTQYNLTDSRNDGNTVYGYTTGSLFQSNYDGTTSWINQGSYSTPEIKNTTSTMYTSFPLSSSGSRARGAVMVCAQMGFPVPDSCSGNSYPTFDY